MTNNKRTEKLTLEEVKIILDTFKTPSWMLANIDAGGEFIAANFGMTVKKVNGEYVAIIEN